MDQRSDDIKQDIEATRAALDEKLDLLETKARETFDLRRQVGEHPWLALGAAVAAGYMLGSMGGNGEQRWHGQPMVTTDYTQHIGREPAQHAGAAQSDRLLAQFDDEITMIKAAAIAAMANFLRDTIKEVVPALGRQLKQTVKEGWNEGGKSETTAPTASFSQGAGAWPTNYDEVPPVQTPFGSPPPVSSGGSEYYEAHTPRTEKDDERAVRETRQYTP